MPEHLPLQRQQKTYAREGVQLLVSTLEDETPLQIPDTRKGQVRKGKLWVYVSAAGNARDIVVYDCRPGRAGQYARERLSGWSGTLVADGYAGYRALFRDGQEGAPPVAPGIREVGCMAHVRRKFMVLYRMNGSPGTNEM